MSRFYQINCIFLGYFFGSILTAHIVTKLFTGKNIEDLGNHNPGMSNVYHSVGLLPAVLVLLGDVGKTILPTFIAMSLFNLKSFSDTCLYVGFGAIVGHDYPIWKNFKGGKGVANSCAWFVLTYWPLGLLCLLISFVCIILTSSLSLTAVIMSIIVIPISYIKKGRDALRLTIVAALLMFHKNKEGIIGLFTGETKLKLKTFKK